LAFNIFAVLDLPLGLFCPVCVCFSIAFPHACILSPSGVIRVIRDSRRDSNSAFPLGTPRITQQITVPRRWERALYLGVPHFPTSHTRVRFPCQTDVYMGHGPGTNFGRRLAQASQMEVSHQIHRHSHRRRYLYRTIL
jgi:hypothetical protein